MKISQLREMLQAVQDEHGDIDVYCWPYDGQARTFDITEKLEPTESPLAEGRKVLFIDSD
ncbi:MAG: hypothetical protein AB2792_01945 [Candidatus Thiodiazotropha sp.]